MHRHETFLWHGMKVLEPAKLASNASRTVPPPVLCVWMILVRRILLEYLPSKHLDYWGSKWKRWGTTPQVFLYGVVVQGGTLSRGVYYFTSAARVLLFFRAGAGFPPPVFLLTHR